MAKILIADDSAFVRTKLVSILQSVGHEVIEAVDGSTVLKWAIAEQPDVIMLDLMMPGIDGWTTLGDLKMHEQTLDIPVIIASSLNSDADLMKAYKLGAFDFLPKPWTSDDLIRRIRWASLAIHVRASA
jgi:CheY-like chemotaxis protein